MDILVIGIEHIHWNKPVKSPSQKHVGGSRSTSNGTFVNQNSDIVLRARTGSTIPESAKLGNPPHNSTSSEL